MSEIIKLAGADRGLFRPWREVKGGLWLLDGDSLINKPCALRLVPRKVMAACQDYARQWFAQRGDKNFLAGQLSAQVYFFLLHFALIEPVSESGTTVPLFGSVPVLADATGKLSIPAASALPLGDAADGQLDRLVNEYELLKQTQTPDGGLTHAQWEALIAEGKAESLRTLHSRHGSSALIRVLSGLDGVPYPD
jgi:hypothetical protein